MDYGSRVTLKARCFANFGLVTIDVAPIIGYDVQIGQVRAAADARPTSGARAPAAEMGGPRSPSSTGNNVWLGGGAIVLPGSDDGDNTVVGAGSVVTRDLPANVVAVGNPAA